MTDFPDRDEWTDRPLAVASEGECDACGKIGELVRVEAYGIETYACEKCRNIREKALAEDAMEDAEWDALGATDLLSPEELALKIKPTDLSNNEFSDV